MIIKHNLPALNSIRQVETNNKGTASNLQKLSSGLKINKAADDAAGLAISEKMRAQIRGMSMASQNCENGISLIQTAEGGLNESHAILQRMRELAVQSANGTYEDENDRFNMNKEVQALKSELDRIAYATEYNGIPLLDGNLGAQDLSALPGGANGVATGSIAAFVNTLKGMGLDLNIDDSNDISRNVFVYPYSSEFNGQSMDLVITSPQQDGANGMAIKVGSQTYSGILYEADGTVETADGQMVTIKKGEYAFFDEAGELVSTAKLARTNGNPVAITEGNPGVISGISLPDPCANKEVPLVPKTDGLGTEFFEPGDVLYGASVASSSDGLIFQIGANGFADQQVGLQIENMASINLGSKIPTAFNPTGTIRDISINPQENANDSIAVIDDAINQVSSVRADLGALQNRMDHTLNNLGVTGENLTAAESRIRDVDMALEMMDFTKNSILVQASQSMLAQANQLPQGILSLLQ